MKTTSSLLTAIILLSLLPLFQTTEKVEGVGGVDVTAFFDLPTFYVNATPQDPCIAQLTGYVMVTRSPTVVQNVVVTLEGSAEGHQITITPSSLTFTYEEERKNFSVAVRVPDIVSQRWESIQVSVGGTWQLVPGLNSGKVTRANATLLPAPSAYITARTPKEKYLGEVGDTVKIPVTFENLGDTAGQVVVTVENEQDLSDSSLDVEYPRLPITVSPGVNTTIYIEVTKGSGAGGKYGVEISLKPYNPYGGTPDNVRRVVVPGELNVTVEYKTSFSGVARSPYFIGGITIVALVVAAVLYFVRKGKIVMGGR